MTEINGIRTWSYVHKNKVIHKISDQYVKACRRKVQKTVTDGRTDGRTETRTDGHHHTIIRPVWRRAYKNTNLVEDIEILLPVKFRWIPFNSFRWKVENVSANQRPGWQSYFFDRPEKHKLGRGHWDLASCQVSLNSIQQFKRRKVENISANQRPGRPSCFSDRPKKHKLGRWRWVLAACQVSLNSVQWFQRRSRKCEKLTTDTRTTDGRRTKDNAWSQ